MNYNDYMEIMEAEGLTLPKIGQYLIDNAIWCNNIIKTLKAETSFDTKKQVKEMEEQKIGWILDAIDMARMAKEMPIPFQWADKEFAKRR